MWTKFMMIATLLMCWALPLNALAAEIDSVYTDLGPEKCRTIEVVQDPMPSSLQRCPGIAGYRLLVADDDLRQTVTVISPDGKKHPLDLWHVITGAFSSVGSKAEWRIIKEKGKIVPVALIIRVNANEDLENPNRVRSYLAVAKITRREICVTDKISPGSTANQQARSAADSSAQKPCLKSTIAMNSFGRDALHAPASAHGRTGFRGSAKRWLGSWRQVMLASARFGPDSKLRRTQWHLSAPTVSRDRSKSLWPSSCHRMGLMTKPAFSSLNARCVDFRG